MYYRYGILLKKTIPTFIIMEIEYRSVITFCFWVEINVRRLEKSLRKFIKPIAFNYSHQVHWFNEFKRSRTSVFDGHCPGRPISESTDDVENKIHDVVIDDRQIKVREIYNFDTISTERNPNILHKESARWVPRLLTIDKRNVAC